MADLVATADLLLSEESKDYQKLAFDFFQNELAPKNEELDREGKFPKALYDAAWELGLAGSILPESCGGLGLSLFDAVVMAEEAGAASAGFAAAFEGNALAAAPLILDGSKEQQEKYLGALCSQAQLAAFCFSPQTEEGLTASAVAFKKSGRKLRLNTGAGSCKLLAMNGSLASWYFVLAFDEDTKKKTAFVFQSGLAGIKAGAQIEKLGRRCSDLVYLELEGLELGPENIVGDEGQGDEVFLRSLSLSFPLLAAHLTGLIRSALEHSIRYSKERETFGKPISQHQALAFMLADMAKSAECSRLMALKAARLFDQGSRDPYNAIAARSFAAEAAIAASVDAVQIFGGYGYSKEYPVERLMRDAKMMQMTAGSSLELNCAIAEMELAAACGG